MDNDSLLRFTPTITHFQKDYLEGPPIQIFLNKGKDDVSIELNQLGNTITFIDIKELENIISLIKKNLEEAQYLLTRNK